MTIKRSHSSCFTLAVTFMTLLFGMAPSFSQSLNVRYEVTVSNPRTKIFHVCGWVSGAGRQFLQLDWPAWTPGYAIIWDYGQHVLQLTAQAETGFRLSTYRLSQNRWVIVNRQAKDVKFCFDVRANDTENDLGFAQAYLDSVSGWYNGAAMFPEIDGFRASPHIVRFSLPEGWRVGTAMLRGEAEGEFRAADYDELVDSPVQLGEFLQHEIRVAGIPISIVVAGIQNIDMDGLTTTIKKIAENQFHLLGQPGLDRYLFIYHSGIRGAGGLEHRNAVTISLRREEYTKKDSWLKVVTAHELFHVWNAKRIHSESFDRYDYSRPHRSKQVWFAEGITAYYTDLTLFRAGLFNKQELYKSLADVLDMYENNRARSRLSWEDISWYIWEEEIRQGLGVWLLPGWMIDLKIRDVSNNRFSLDDVIRFLDAWYGGPGKGYPEGGLGSICTAVAQEDLRTFFDRHIAGYDPFPYDSLFSAAGLVWNRATRQAPDIGGELFWSMQQTAKAIGVEEGGIAYIAGVRSGDIIQSINGVTYGRQEFAKFKSGIQIGDTLNLVCLRGGREILARLHVGSRTLIKSTISELEHPTERQRRILDGILKGLPR